MARFCQLQVLDHYDGNDRTRILRYDRLPLSLGDLPLRRRGMRLPQGRRRDLGGRRLGVCDSSIARNGASTPQLSTYEWKARLHMVPGHMGFWQFLDSHRTIVSVSHLADLAWSCWPLVIPAIVCHFPSPARPWWITIQPLRASGLRHRCRASKEQLGAPRTPPR